MVSFRLVLSNPTLPEITDGYEIQLHHAKGHDPEIRKDILGHINKDVNEGTYSQVARLRLMKKSLMKLPRPSAAVEPAKIRPLPQVLAHTPRQTRKQANG